MARLISHDRLLGRDGLLVALAGSAAVAAYVGIYLKSPPLGSPAHLALIGVASAAYIVVVFRLVIARGRSRPSTAIVAACLIFAAAFRVPLWLTGPGNDVFRYVWDARVHHLGYNPYVVVPSDPAFASLHTAETRRMNHPELPTPYPPGAQIFFQIVHHFRGDAYAFKLALAICDGVVLFLLWRWLVVNEVGPEWLIPYAWNPLVILVTAGEAHLDVLGAAWLLASVLLLKSGHRLGSALSFAMAIAVKPLPLVLVPIYWRRVQVVDALLAVGLITWLYAPYAGGGVLPIGSLGVFLGQFRFNHTLFAVTEGWFGAFGAAMAATLVALAVSAWLRFRFPAGGSALWAWPMAIAMILGPVVYPWYLVWVIPFCVGFAMLPLLAWSIAILGTYVVWYGTLSGMPWVVPSIVSVAQVGTILAVSVWVLRQRREAPSPPLASADDWPDHPVARDSMKLSVIVPTYHEESLIGRTLAHTRAVIGAHELIVVDGCSTDRTLDIARAYARVMTIDKPRGAALNQAAAAASGNVLLFLHADTLLPPGAIDAIDRALGDREVVGGAFRLSFDDPRWGPRLVAAWVNARSRMWNVFLGDQALFVRKMEFFKAGGFRGWNLMEDLEILSRLRRRGRLALLSPPIVTSARRHQRQGWLRTLGTVWMLTWLHFLGLRAGILTKLYPHDR